MFKQRLLVNTQRQCIKEWLLVTWISLPSSHNNGACGYIVPHYYVGYLLQSASNIHYMFVQLRGYSQQQQKIAAHSLMLSFERWLFLTIDDTKKVNNQLCGRRTNSDIPS